MKHIFYNTEICNNITYDAFSNEFDKWESSCDKAAYFIENGRTIPLSFNRFCINIWGIIQNKRQNDFDMFREQMLNTATTYQTSLKDALFKTVCNFK